MRPEYMTVIKLPDLGESTALIERGSLYQNSSHRVSRQYLWLILTVPASFLAAVPEAMFAGDGMTIFFRSNSSHVRRLGCTMGFVGEVPLDAWEIYEGASVLTPRNIPRIITNCMTLGTFSRCQIKFPGTNYSLFAFNEYNRKIHPILWGVVEPVVLLTSNICYLSTLCVGMAATCETLKDSWLFYPAMSASIFNTMTCAKLGNALVHGGLDYIITLGDAGYKRMDVLKVLDQSKRLINQIARENPKTFLEFVEKYERQKNLIDQLNTIHSFLQNNRHSLKEESRLKKYGRPVVQLACIIVCLFGGSIPDAELASNIVEPENISTLPVWLQWMSGIPKSLLWTGSALGMAPIMICAGYYLPEVLKDLWDNTQLSRKQKIALIVGLLGMGSGYVMSVMGQAYENPFFSFSPSVAMGSVSFPALTFFAYSFYGDLIKKIQNSYQCHRNRDTLENLSAFLQISNVEEGRLHSVAESARCMMEEEVGDLKTYVRRMDYNQVCSCLPSNIPVTRTESPWRVYGGYISTCAGSLWSSCSAFFGNRFTLRRRENVGMYPLANLVRP